MHLPLRPSAASPNGHLTRRAAIEAVAGCLMLAGHAGAQTPAANRRSVFQYALPDIAIKNWSVTAVEVTYGPGESSAAHRHPGITIAYVLEGEVRSKVGDGPERTYKEGEMFLETPGQLHAVSANASTSRPAKLLAVLLAETGATLTTPEK
jgi:quercetin dioxygenase-like cupin family protein